MFIYGVHKPLYTSVIVMSIYPIGIERSFKFLLDFVRQAPVPKRDQGSFQKKISCKAGSF